MDLGLFSHTKPFLGEGGGRGKGRVRETERDLKKNWTKSTPTLIRKILWLWESDRKTSEKSVIFKYQNCWTLKEKIKECNVKTAFSKIYCCLFMSICCFLDHQWGTIPVRNGLSLTFKNYMQKYLNEILRKTGK